jgi:hypothetical protein
MLKVAIFIGRWDFAPAYQFVVTSRRERLIEAQKVAAKVIDARGASLVCPADSALSAEAPLAAPQAATYMTSAAQARRHAMTPQDSELVDELFNRLAQLETAQRDPEAEHLIADGLRRAPHAVYALVQTVLLQDEALKRANARIEELQMQTGAAAEPEQRPTSFLDSMREALGGRAPHGSVPSVRTAVGNQSQRQQPQPGYPQQMPLSGYPGGPGLGSGGSFLGTAASAAAGVIGGSLLLDGIRSAFGHHLGGTYADREQDRQQDLADDRQQELADADREQDRQQDLADEDAQQDSEQDQTDDEDFASDDDFSDDSYDA